MKNAINIKDLKIGYDKKIIIDDLDLSIEEGKEQVLLDLMDVENQLY